MTLHNIQTLRESNSESCPRTKAANYAKTANYAKAHYTRSKLYKYVANCKAANKILLITSVSPH